MSNVVKAGTVLPSDYDELLEALKLKVHAARMRAALAANSELVNLYLEIGREIGKRQERDGWGSGVIARLAKDLKAAYPNMKGLSSCNLLYMKQIAEAFGSRPISQQLVAKLPWGHSLTLLEKLSAENERVWCGLKDPYIFDFLSVGDNAHEREIERELVRHITEFLLELGSGFAYVGKQVPLTVGDGEFYLDLLFYHLKLHCYVVIELKAGEFKPEYAGKLNFYLSAVDDSIRGENDKHTIGLILCKGKDRVLAEYALRGMNQPMAIADYDLTKAIPEDLKGALPSIAEIEAELGDHAERHDEPPLEYR